MKGISVSIVSLKFRMILIIFVCDRTGFHELNCKDKRQDQADSLRSDAVQSVGADAVESSEAHSPKGPLPNPESPELDDETKEWSDMSDGEQEMWIKKTAARSKQRGGCVQTEKRNRLSLR